MNEKIFIIGFGFIGRYLAPCYEALLGQPTPEQVLAVKASSRGVEELRQQYPYAISVGDTAAVLERETSHYSGAVSAAHRGPGHCPGDPGALF